MDHEDSLSVWVVVALVALVVAAAVVSVVEKGVVEGRCTGVLDSGKDRHSVNERNHFLPLHKMRRDRGLLQSIIRYTKNFRGCTFSIKSDPQFGHSAAS